MTAAFFIVQSKPTFKEGQYHSHKIRYSKSTNSKVDPLPSRKPTLDPCHKIDKSGSAKKYKHHSHVTPQKSPVVWRGEKPRGNVLNEG